ncbi:MAG TPA: alpha-L-fucosidase [Candidatus Eisenbergiella merdipullorum]|uniref:alpha-L-fucosidase n=1 Tax=Candidatus Eisenbergiella merdipullorum TaxID=2838553 RepID=A0A9D2I590_9FIRM|nr:alpha-L-fucosidase [Candidatus Eisenbergiella merdipullorum]
MLHPSSFSYNLRKNDHERRTLRKERYKKMTSYVTRKTPGDTAWFTHDRFGMFIHFGLYALPARHEWIKNRERISEEKYDLYFKHFNPDLLDPKDWARQAKAAGMKYAVLTTKHHEGFCLFDSKYTDYKSTNTPCGRDLVREYVDAFREAGLRVGFYYSLIDWHHPDFPIDMQHPRRDDPDAFEQNQGRDMKKYAQYMRDQVTELLTNYGKIDILWFDFSYSNYNGTGDKAWMKGKGKDDWEAEKLIATARSLQPDIIIDNRTEIEQDLWTPEQYQPTQWMTHPETGELVTWEACQTFSGSWGYYRDEMTWKSPEMLIRMLVNTVSLGGNLLMNVGPTARGYLDYRAEAALAVYADWMKYNSRSIYGCTMAEPEFETPADCRLTQSEDGKRIYVHLFAYPFAHLKLKGFAGKIKYAQFLHDGSEVLFTEGKIDHFSAGKEKEEADTTILYLPDVKPHCLVPVIEIFLK